jgi:hypothetical protein
MRFHPYFLNSVRRRRPDVTERLCERVLADAIRREVQMDGRIRHWGYIPELGRYLRVITPQDGETVLNAFFDRGFKP